MSSSNPVSPRPVRRRGPILIMAAGMLFIGWAWWKFQGNLQFRIMGTYLGFILMAGAMSTWALAQRGWPWSRRLLPGAFCALAVIVALSLVRVRGVTGDWIPVVEWRYGNGESTQTVLAEAQATSSVFPGYLGPNNDSTIDGVALDRDWDANPPQLVWKRPVGAGWAGFALDGNADLAITMEQQDDATEAVVAYRLSDGSELWRQGVSSYFSNPMAGPGPRTTPTISQDRVFALGARGQLWALDRANGEIVWQRSVLEENQARVPEHGLSNSPVLVDELVLIQVGGTNGNGLVAYRQEDGAVAWSSGDEPNGYSTPVVATLDGRRQVVTLNKASVTGYDLEEGAQLWRHEYPNSPANVAPPLILDNDRVLFSTGYGVGSRAFAVRGNGEGQEVELLWESTRMKAKFTNLVLHDGVVYGLDDGRLAALDPETGDLHWKRKRYGHGNVLLVGDLLLVLSERGDISLIEPTPEEHRELASFTALRGKTWNPMAFASPYLLVRSDEEAALWRLPIAEGGPSTPATAEAAP